jgi:hypothetical protein
MPTVASAPIADPAVHVRDDLWVAFNSSSSQWVYDRSTDSARRIFDRPDAEIGPDLVRIPNGRDRVVDWMRSFAQAQSPATRALLLSLLSGTSAVYRFKDSLKSDPNLARSWRRYQIQQVVAAIGAWAASNKINPKDVTTPHIRVQRTDYRPLRSAAPFTPVAMQTPVASVSSAPTPPAPSAGLAPRLETLIGELIDQLLLLRGTLQVMGPRS